MLIILVCSLGISSTLLVKKLEEEVKTQKLPIEIQAMALQDVLQQAHIDFVLLSPQISYAKRQIISMVETEDKVYAIDSFDYSSLNAKRIIEQIIDKLSERM